MKRQRGGLKKELYETSVDMLSSKIQRANQIRGANSRAQMGRKMDFQARIEAARGNIADKCSNAELLSK